VSQAARRESDSHSTCSWKNWYDDDGRDAVMSFALKMKWVSPLLIRYPSHTHNCISVRYR
jgi:hypothetical protein